jgi:hypothetical protein
MTPPLLDVPLLALYPVEPEEVNELLSAWEHRLGPVNRPFTQQGWVLCLDTRPAACAMSGSTVSATVAGYARTEVVELTRLCARPDLRWINRVMLRLWREVGAPRWPDWEVKAAVSYSHNSYHAGEIYRCDGWKLVREACGSGGGGCHSRPRYATGAVYGKKRLWLWKYDP